MDLFSVEKYQIKTDQVLFSLLSSLSNCIESKIVDVIE